MFLDSIAATLGTTGVFFLMAKVKAYVRRDGLSFSDDNAAQEIADTSLPDTAVRLANSVTIPR